jgi:ubiquinone/menaquinone biosynthesis C-methylase UbiE
MKTANSFYEKHVKDYQKFTNLYFPKRHAKLISLIQNHESMTILDVGCGTGIMLERIKHVFPFAKLYGADLSGSMIAYAKKSYPDFEFQVADAEKLPFADSTFWAVTNAISFHHYQQPLKAIEEAYRTLKPNGQFLLMDITPKHSLTRKINDFGAKYLVRDGHVAFQSLSNVKTMFEQAGFQDIQQHFIGFPGVYVTKGQK